MRRAILAVLTVSMLGLLGASCGGGGGSGPVFNLIPGNSELILGPNRITFGVVDGENNRLLDDPGNSVAVQFKDTGGKLIGEAEQTTFVEAIPGTTGFWMLNHVFEADDLRAEDGTNYADAQITIVTGGETVYVDISFIIRDKGFAPAIGEDAPRTENPTLASEPNTKKLTSDPEPSLAFYQMTVNQALEAQKPFVVIFSTPAFCQSQLCGPALDHIKAVQPEFADRVNFIHIEPYKLDDNGGLLNGGLQPTQSTTDWHLDTEPWVFVVGSDGKITDRFEGTAGEDELRQSLNTVLS